MGLIKAIAGAVGGTLKDQWLDLIKCDNMDMDTLMVNQTTKTDQISKGSRILVAPGQVAVIYDSGSVLDATAEEGVYTFDQSSSPSFFGSSSVSKRFSMFQLATMMSLFAAFPAAKTAAAKRRLATCIRNIRPCR